MNRDATRKLLLIDDDLAFGESLARFFADGGLQVSVVSDGELVTGMDLERFSVVLLDIDMPGRSGLATLREIRARSGVPLIMVSCHSGEKWRLESLALGADFFLPKPLSLGELELVVRNLIWRDIKSRSAEPVWTLRRSDRSLMTPDMQRIGLTALEFSTVEKLIQSNHSAVPRDVLIDDPTKMKTAVLQSRAVDVMISRLKKHCLQLGMQLPIKSLRNIGYVFHASGTIID